MRIIDCHSHIGYDLGCQEASLDGYLDMSSKQGITDSLLMPVPNQIYMENNQQKLYLRWKYVNGKIIYYSDYYTGKIENPYFITNDNLFKRLNFQNTDVDLYFVPLIHPLLDSFEYLEFIKRKYNPVAVKIHGLASGIYPSLLNNPETISKLKMLNLPIIVHTDYMSSKPIGFDIRNVNDAIDWINLFNYYNLKGYITHCARMEPKALNEINKSKNLVLGLGPDKLLSFSKEEMFSSYRSVKDMLQSLKEIIVNDKLLFDVDYNWNYSEDGRNDIFDIESVERVKEVFKDNREKVLSKNAERFFEI